MTDCSKILVLFADEDQQKAFDKFSNMQGSLGDVTIKKCNFDQFQEGKRFDKFDFVIAYVNGTAPDDFEMQIEFWSHYAIAPVFAALCSEEAQGFIKEKLTDTAITIISAEGSMDDLVSAVN